VTSEETLKAELSLSFQDMNLEFDWLENAHCSASRALHDILRYEKC
jgi:hypothetical protein